MNQYLTQQKPTSFKMMCLITFLLLGVANVLTSSIYSKLELNDDKQYNLDEAEDIFLEFIQKHNKNYKNDEEYQHRYRIFVENLKQINQLNGSPTTTFKVNQFADLTHEEFSKRYTGLVLDNVVSENVVEYVPTGTAPDSLDWRQQNLVTEVKNQEECGSCYIFSAVACIEGQHAKKHNELISLSEQQALDCGTRGCDGGWPIEVMTTLAKQNGSMREADYAYTELKDNCQTEQSKIVVKVTGGQQLKVASEEELKSALAQYGPLSVCISTKYAWQYYHGGILTPTDCDGTPSHAVLLVGYGNENGSPYWIIKNSWATSWGESGYIRLARNLPLCGITSVVTLASVA